MVPDAMHHSPTKISIKPASYLHKNSGTWALNMTFFCDFFNPYVKFTTN